MTTRLDQRAFPLLPIAAGVTSVFGAVPSFAQDGATTLEEVLVTARKRTESVQDIPSSIQAISGDDIREMGARGMADYTRFLSSVDVISYGNGSSNVVFRGATVDGGGSYISQSTSSVYLDEISVTSTGAQPSIRMVDISQVEALAGPQGTLYGSDAQAGTLRIITNKPVMNEFQAVVDGSARYSEEGDPSWDGSVVLNIPLMEDRLALRLVGFGAKDGGFIDNVYGHTPDTSVVNGAGFFPSGFGDLDNAQYVEDDWNDSEITGWRAQLRWDINENWTSTAGYLHQETDSGAYNSFDPNVGDLETVRFYDDWRKDEYDLYSLTIEGDLGFAQLVSATSYYDREIESVTDLTAYHHYWSGVYCQTYALDPNTYYWYYANPDGSGVVMWPAYCAAPTVEGDYLAVSEDPAQQDRFTQEFRLSSQGDTLDWLVGLYYEESNNSWQANFGVPTSNTFQESIAHDYWSWLDGRPHPEGEATWYSQSSTDWEQTAIFGEVVWHISDRLDLTLGGRYFERENVNTYFVERPNGRLADDYVDGVEKHSGEETEFIPKVAVSFDFTDDVMAYALVSQGYRPGGTNRSRGEPFFPTNYAPDKMTNYETGVRTTLAGGRGRLNLTAFYMDWEDYQLEIVDPSSIACVGGEDAVAQICGQPWQQVVGNAGDAHILGSAIEFDWAFRNNVVFGMNAEFLEAENDSNLDLDGDGFNDVEKGQRLPITSRWKGSAWVNYDWPVDSVSGNGYARLQWSYRGENLNQLEPVAADGSNPNPQFSNAAYDQGDLILGLTGQTWDVSIFVNNITDERAQYTNESGLFEFGMASVQDGRPHTGKTYTNRPREFGLRVIKRWGGS